MLKGTLESVDPKSLIQAELSERCRRNPRYSLRAFSKACGISHTILSLVLSGKRPLSKKAAQKLATALDLDPVKKQELIQSRAKATTLKETAPSGYRQISLDTFSVISDWYHYAILSLLEISGSRFEAGWLAKTLKITRLEAKLAMERLVRLALVGKVGTGPWKQTGKPLHIGNLSSTEATRRFHKQLLGKAVESLENHPSELRNFSSMTFALDPSQIPLAQLRIQEFRRALVAELESKGSPKAVYGLTVELFPLSQITKEESK